VQAACEAYQWEAQKRVDRKGWDGFRGTQRFVAGNISSEGLKSPEILGLIAVKARDLFGETSRWTFVKEDLSKLLLFSEVQICR